MPVRRRATRAVVTGRFYCRSVFDTKQEPDTYETMLARAVQRSGCLDAIIDTCFAMIDVGDGPLNEQFHKVLVDQVTRQRYAQMSGASVSFTVPQRVAYILSVLGMRPASRRRSGSIAGAISKLEEIILAWRPAPVRGFVTIHRRLWGDSRAWIAADCS